MLTVEDVLNWLALESGILERFTINVHRNLVRIYGEPYID